MPDIVTSRLILRRWRARDFEPYAAMCADPEVMRWLGSGVVDRDEAAMHIERIEDHHDRHGFGRMVIERRDDGAFLGWTGVHRIFHELPITGVEIGWRLARPAWGAGYASEAAGAATADGFARFGWPEVLAFTAQGNVRSQAVAGRAGFVRDASRDFDHPNLPPGHELRRHLVFAAARDGYGA